MTFGELNDGDKFYYNCFKWRKDTFLREKVRWGRFKGVFKNAKNLDDLSNRAYFADYIEVEPI